MERGRQKGKGRSFVGKGGKKKKRRKRGALCEGLLGRKKNGVSPKRGDDEWIAMKVEGKCLFGVYSVGV